MLDRSKFNQNPGMADCLVVLERFILTFLSSWPIKDGYQTKDIEAHFKALSDLGIKQVALVIPEEFIKDRILSTSNYRNDIWKDHLFSKGDKQQSIVKYYLDWQSNFLNYIDKYKHLIDIFVIEITDCNYKRYGDLIFQKYFDS
ncbi:MAG: hypothetical protein COT24_00580 [Candidatus Kerfeldbacteria bacterium CG08_land_8_20_14_0_20_40_16]|uniref:Deoxynucleoside kinase domain-containing protein n=1 Tax=Candidatus Kerfeldbacteria bacterium CG08_land_8_20_14_0_20_40_16 TaxID=2014244 RepID=A0A2H0YX10_9BACT|nr:MAG: hypothetical protein COT24_00580 [Candidatus Kerfeldbacteria bacterium CG08_land_8_20_14_0_20_40_16]